MATYDASIILQGQPVDVIGAMGRGNELAAQTNALRAQTDMRNLYRTQGANILAGDQGALNALAGIDPMAAIDAQKGQLGMQSTRLDMQATQQRMDVLSREEQRAIEAFKAEKGAAAAAAAAAQIEDSVRMGMAIPDAASWDAFMSQNAPELVGQFANRQALAARYMSMAEVLKMNDAPSPLSSMGKFYADQKAGLLPADAKPPQEGTTINLGGGSDKQVFDAMIADRDAARSVASGYNAIKEAKAAVDAGIISGIGADQVLGLQKLGAALGIADPTIIQNTETFRSAIAPQVAAILKATAGTANLSNADREFAEKAAGGSISLDAGTIRRLLAIMEKASRSNLESYQSRLDTVYPDGQTYGRERAILGIQMPQFLPQEPLPPQGPRIDIDGFQIEALD